MDWQISMPPKSIVFRMYSGYLQFFYIYNWKVTIRNLAQSYYSQFIICCLLQFFADVLLALIKSRIIKSVHKILNIPKVNSTRPYTLPIILISNTMELIWLCNKYWQIWVFCITVYLQNLTRDKICNVILLVFLRCKCILKG